MSRALRSAPPAPAYVLHSWDWSESSLILDLFTRPLGRVAVVAKGAKRPYSQLRSVLLPFQRLNVTLGRQAAGEETAEIQTLRSAEWAGGQATLGGEALFTGFYLNELLMKLLARHDPHPALFDAYAQTLPALVPAQAGPGGSPEAGDAATQRALRAFELVLLREIGLLPELGLLTATLKAAEPGGRYMLRPEVGVVPAVSDEPALSGADLGALQAALDAGDLPELQAACGSALLPLRGQLRTLLHYHLGLPTLRTREVMLDVQRLVDSARQRRHPSRT